MFNLERLNSMKPVLKIEGNIARSVNPYGCRQEVLNQINYVKSKGKYDGPKKVLILGGSSSYGLATRITTAFGSNADTINVSYERGPKSVENLGTAGWYNNIFFKEFSEKEGLVAKNFIGDAYSSDMKKQVVNYIKEKFGGKIDLLVYSLAAPKRIDLDQKKVWRSVLKPVNNPVIGENINLENESLFTQTVMPASLSEIENTTKVMGGEDWEIWIDTLKEAGVLSEGFKTVLYSYIGSKLTYPIYHKGTLGIAKTQAEKSAERITKGLKEVRGNAIICVSTVVTTKASVVIPILPKYMIALYKVMMDEATHETPIMHKDRVYRDMMYGDYPVFDDKGRLRADEYELRESTQRKVKKLFYEISNDNFNTKLTGYNLFRKEFLNTFGFEVEHTVNDEFILEDLLKLRP
jgi:enoyl-[acyl-carrier protein] reductase/trans-2-enoyl-CoA reductase (NAD+)